MQDHSTAGPTRKPAFKPCVRRLGPGRYLVESASRPGRDHTTMATSCSCTGYSYRKDCRHVALVRSLEPAMERWYGQVTAGVSRLAGRALHLDRLDDAERQLGSALRALADTDRQADEYAIYLREVDEAERAVAALNYDEMRALV